ncbi:ABC transporter ATP-binding protein [Treponema pedis]|uniref:ABC transporter ATP-binding protein n=1 Tax=Treponema pedis TaxID=409322 RepID=UPI0003F65579|nr:ABC transporter ATP-binding protein [Treponema pedis]
MKEAEINYTFRAFRLLFKKEPKLFISIFIYNICAGVFPFIGIYFSAKILNELIYLKNNSFNNTENIRFLVLAAILCTALIMLIQSFGKRWLRYERTGKYYKCDNVYIEKLFDMDFKNIEAAEVQALYAKIKQNAIWGEWGMERIIYIFTGFSENIIKIISSVALTVSLFSFKVTVPSLQFLNNPIFIFILSVLLILFIIIPAKLYTLSEKFWTELAEDATEGNRVYSFFYRLFNEKERAMDIRIYNQLEEGEKIFRYSDIFKPTGKLAYHAKRKMGLYVFSAQAISSSIIIIIYGFVGLKALGGAFPLGNLTQYIASITVFASALTGIFKNAGMAKNNSEFLKVCFEFLDIKNEMYSGDLPLKQNEQTENIIEFKNVSFSYPNQDISVLKNINFTLKANTKLAVVGKNGSGKTTFIKLLCRLYDPSEGEILFNGINIKEYSYKEYISLFSVVFQDFKLSAFTLAENVAAGTIYDEKKVNEVLAQAGFTPDKEKFTNGIQTFLFSDFDKNGVTVSGGERQKIAIARLLYKNSPYAVLDEPTAALDPVTEQEIYSNFNGMVKDKTSVFISHRLSSCKFCDEIIVFDEGQIVQHGTHEELVKDTNGVYKTLWDSQARHYL